MKHPVIISAPHAHGKIPRKFKKKIALSDFEIWQMHDPFTGETCQYPNAFAIHCGKNHRILGDFNRDRKADDIFRETDFYGRTIWKENQKLTSSEKKELLKEQWDVYRKNLEKSFEKIAKAGHKKVLFIDHHNTATDHPANKGQYLPPIVLGNFGKSQTTETTSSKKIIEKFQEYLEEFLPSINTEINKVYQGGDLIRFVNEVISPKYSNIQIEAIILEYNLNLIFNPLSKRIDRHAKKKLTKGINQAIEKLVKTFFIQIKMVFSNKKFILISLLVSLIFYAFNASIGNLSLIFSSYSSMGLKSIKLYFLLLYGYSYSITTASFITLTIISILFGILFSLMLYKTLVFRRAQKNKLGFITSIGIFLGIAAPGCAACGIGLLPLIGLSTGSLLLLPFSRLELSIF